jgi:hypothetical protein
MSLDYISFYPQIRDVGETHSLVPATVQQSLANSGSANRGFQESMAVHSYLDKNVSTAFNLCKEKSSLLLK